MSDTAPDSPAPAADSPASAAEHHPVTEVYDRQPPAEGTVFAPEPPRTVYVVAPTPPRKQGNRSFGVLVAVPATIVYAIVLAIVDFVILAATRPQGDSLHVFLEYVTTGSFWVQFCIPVLFFFLAMILLVAIVNLGRWWAYILGGFFVGVVVYFSYIGGALVAAAAWEHTPAEVGEFIGQLWAHPLTIAAAVVAREVSIWAGAWIAAHARTVRQRNADAHAAYEHELATGPAPTAPVPAPPVPVADPGASAIAADR